MKNLERILKIATPIVVVGLATYMIYQSKQDQDPQNYLNKIREKGF